MTFNREQAMRYLAEGGKRCPACESDQIDVGSFDDQTDGTGYQWNQCRDCEEEWFDVWKLCDVREA